MFQFMEGCSFLFLNDKWWKVDHLEGGQVGEQLLGEATRKEETEQCELQADDWKN